MNRLLQNLQDQINTRVIAGLLILALIGGFLFFDWALKRLDEVSVSVATLSRQIEQLKRLDASDVQEGLQEQLAADLDTYTARLIAEETDGLNLARLQSETLNTLAQCGLSGIRSDVSLETHSVYPEYTAYILDLRITDRGIRFPLCLRDLEASDLTTMITNLTWTRNGSLLLTLQSYGKTREVE